MTHLTCKPSIVAKPASGNGDLAGFKVSCGCGDTASFSFKSMAEEYARDHVEYMATRPAPKKARRVARKAPWMPQD